jgi:hypothetical protein
MRDAIKSDEMKAIAKALIWWQPPEVSMAEPRRFLQQVMALGTWSEVCEVRRNFGVEAFRDAILNATPGVFDIRSWAYWRAVVGLPPAELPVRSLK